MRGPASEIRRAASCNEEVMKVFGKWIIAIAIGIKFYGA